jgi:energy-coupling factor transporter transmembrane protein EcfT
MRWILALSFCGAAFCAAYPMYVIRPFRAQGADELALALLVIQIRPWVTMLCAALAIFAAWKAPTRRIWMGLGAALVCLLAISTRINVFELMFHPVDAPAFAAASDLQLDADEKVLAIRIGKMARAYPVRSIAYHHIVNDAVENRAVVATY